MQANVTDSVLVFKKQNPLISEVVAQGEARVDSGLWKGCGDSELGKGMVVEEEGIQTLGQGVIRCEFDGQ